MHCCKLVVARKANGSLKDNDVMSHGISFFPYKASPSVSIEQLLNRNWGICLPGIHLVALRQPVKMELIIDDI